MKKSCFFFIGLTTVLLSFAPGVPVTSIRQFSWLEGSWQMPAKRGVLVEKWTILNDSSMAGESFMTKEDGNTILLETIELVSRSNSLFYIPTVSKQNAGKPVLFRITAFGSNYFIAENPAHDFPKRISYTRTAADSIRAVIDDGLTEPQKRSAFSYSRQKQ